MRLLLLLLLLPACIEFEKQTILMRWDEKTDVLHVRLIYEGIYADAESKDQLEGSLHQLEVVAAKSSQFFLLDNWPFAFDTKEEPPKLKEVTSVPKDLARFIEVRNGRFFRNEKKQLCAWQDLRIAAATKLFGEINRLFNRHLLEWKKDEPPEPWNEESWPRVQKAAKEGHRWWRLDEEGLALHLLVTDRDADELRAWVVDGLREAFSKDEEGPDVLENRTAMETLLVRNRWSWIQKEDRIVIRLGTGADGVLRIHAAPHADQYEPNLVEPFAEEEEAPKLPLAIDPAVTTKKLETEFLRISAPAPQEAER